MKTFALVLLMTTLYFGGRTENKVDNQVITLTNGTVTIKILPSVGGTLVSASLAGHENILSSDSTLWNEPAEKRPSMNPTPPLKAYNGMVVWVSPQSEWWVKQDINPRLKNSKAQWPPDPYLNYGSYKVIQQSASEITLESPESPNTHVQFTKKFRIKGNKVFITASARNCSKDTLQWGLWFNTRMNGWDKVYIPADTSELIKTNYMVYPNIHQPALKYADGCFSYESVTPEAGKRGYQSKSFFSVKDAVILGYKANQWLIIRGEKLGKSPIHPEQGRIELYVENSANKTRDLQELEIQFGYEKIAPGASIKASENWTILPGLPASDNQKIPRNIKSKL